MISPLVHPTAKPVKFGNRSRKESQPPQGDGRRNTSNLPAEEPPLHPTTKMNAPTPKQEKGISEIRRELAKQKQVPGTSPVYAALFDALDPLVGTVPVIGDFAGAILSIPLLIKAKQNNVKLIPYLGAMLGIVALDVAIGVTPVAGDAVDIPFAANTANALILKEGLKKVKEEEEREAAKRENSGQ